MLTHLWLYWYLDKLQQQEGLEEARAVLQQSIGIYHDAIKKLIVNNPVLFGPCKDDQAIDIALAVLFLSTDQRNYGDILIWLMNMIRQIYYLFQIEATYPCHLYSYLDLLEHPVVEKDGYKEKVTQGSILYPFIAVFSALFDYHGIYSTIQKLKTDHLAHYNFQIWYPDDTSEDNYYINDKMHGATLSHVPIDKDPQSFLDAVFKECKDLENFSKLSAIQYEVWPLILLASRHYRLPVPVNFLMDYWHRGN